MRRIDFLRYISLVAISSLSCFSYSQPEYVVNASKPPEPPHSTSIQLSPDRNAEVLIDNFRAYLDASGRVTLVGNGKGKVGHEEGYSYTVDLESETYTTRRLSYSELREALDSERESLMTIS